MEYVGGRVNPSIVSALTSAHGAALRLHNAFAALDAMSYQKCLNAARAVVSVVQEIRDVDFPTLHIVQGVRDFSSSLSSLLGSLVLTLAKYR